MITGTVDAGQSFSTDTSSVAITLTLSDGVTTVSENLAVDAGSVLQLSDAQNALTVYLATLNAGI